MPAAMTASTKPAPAPLPLAHRMPDGEWPLKATGHQVRYVTSVDRLNELKERLPFLAGDWADSVFVGVVCRGPLAEAGGNAPRLFAVASREDVYVFDALHVGGLIPHLAAFLCNASVIKCVHDLYRDEIVRIATVERPGRGRALAGVLDMQLVAELRHGGGYRDELLESMRKIGAGVPPKSAVDVVKNRRFPPPDLLQPKVLTVAAVETVAQDAAWLQRAGRVVVPTLGSGVLNHIAQSEWRADFVAERNGARAVLFEEQNGWALVSREALVKPGDLPEQSGLSVDCDLLDLIQLLPSDLAGMFGPDEKGALVIHRNEKPRGEEDTKVSLERLNDIVLDVGRSPHVWISGRRFILGEGTRAITREDVDHVVSHVGTFGSDNRAGLEKKLHRVSAMRDRDGTVIGLTLRVGRSVRGNAAMILDVLLGSSKSVLFLGPPCTGKTTIVREAARLLAETCNVCVVDTSNEIAGDGAVPHSCIGHARRMMVPSLHMQSDVMIQCVQNHSPHTMVIDEIGRPREVDAARTVKQRGVRLVASAHGSLRSLLKNKELRGLVGGTETVTLGDQMAREQSRFGRGAVSKLKSQRMAEPTFDVIVEVAGDNLHAWTVVLDASAAVDAILDSKPYDCQVRTREADGNYFRIQDATA
jgi:stage III sporulation protein SpoIIIAA